MNTEAETTIPTELEETSLARRGFNSTLSLVLFLMRNIEARVHTHTHPVVVVFPLLFTLPSAISTPIYFYLLASSISRRRLSINGSIRLF